MGAAPHVDHVVVAARPPAGTYRAQPEIVESARLPVQEGTEEVQHAPPLEERSERGTGAEFTSQSAGVNGAAASLARPDRLHQRLPQIDLPHRCELFEDLPARVHHLSAVEIVAQEEVAVRLHPVPEGGRVVQERLRLAQEAEGVGAEIQGVTLRGERGKIGHIRGWDAVRRDGDEASALRRWPAPEPEVLPLAGE